MEHIIDEVKEIEKEIERLKSLKDEKLDELTNNMSAEGTLNELRKRYTNEYIKITRNGCVTYMHCTSVYMDVLLGEARQYTITLRGLGVEYDTSVVSFDSVMAYQILVHEFKSYNIEIISLDEFITEGYDKFVEYIDDSFNKAKIPTTHIKVITINEVFKQFVNVYSVLKKCACLDNYRNIHIRTTNGDWTVPLFGTNFGKDIEEEYDEIFDSVIGDGTNHCLIINENDEEEIILLKDFINPKEK